jgi:hypothetical protein
MMNTETFTITIEPISDNCLQVTIPEIGAKVMVASTNRDEAIDAAHRAITDYLRQARQVSTAQAS